MCDAHQGMHGGHRRGQHKTYNLGSYGVISWASRPDLAHKATNTYARPTPPHGCLPHRPVTSPSHQWPLTVRGRGHCHARHPHGPCPVSTFSAFWPAPDALGSAEAITGHQFLFKAGNGLAGSAQGTEECWNACHVGPPRNNEKGGWGDRWGSYLRATLLERWKKLTSAK